MNFKELGANLGLEEDEYRELVSLFVMTGGKDFETLRQAVVAGDADTAMRSAHTIKGAAGNLGLKDVSALARVIEDRAMKKDLNSLDQSLQMLKSQIDIVQSFING
jgi:histidine phosphotransfer protein HptB